MLIVYVDDMKMSGPLKHLQTHWDNLGKGGINLAVPPGDNDKRATFLGCDHNRSTKEVKGKLLQCLEWDARAGIRRGIAKYVAAVESVCPGWTPEIYNAYTPFKHIETKVSIHRRPEITKDFIECPACMETFDSEFILKHHKFPTGTQRKVTDVFKKEPRANHLIPDETFESMASVHGGAHTQECGGPQSTAITVSATDPFALPFAACKVDLDLLDEIIDNMTSDVGSEDVRAERNVELCHKLYAQWQHSSSGVAALTAPKGGVRLWNACGRKGGAEPPPNVKGRFFSIAAMILMTFMYQARTARFDIQKPINFMAKRISCWDMGVDRCLHQLVCYLNWTKDHTQIGWIGNSAAQLRAQMFLDADFDGCP